jgi:hypothetical protein
MFTTLAVFLLGVTLIIYRLRLILQAPMMSGPRLIGDLSWLEQCDVAEAHCGMDEPAQVCLTPDAIV